jgi:hypothetical protein
MAANDRQTSNGPLQERCCLPVYPLARSRVVVKIAVSILLPPQLARDDQLAALEAFLVTTFRDLMPVLEHPPHGLFRRADVHRGEIVQTQHDVEVDRALHVVVSADLVVDFDPVLVEPRHLDGIPVLRRLRPELSDTLEIAGIEHVRRIPQPEPFPRKVLDQLTRHLGGPGVGHRDAGRVAGDVGDAVDVSTIDRDHPVATFGYPKLGRDEHARNGAGHPEGVRQFDSRVLVDHHRPVTIVRQGPGRQRSGFRRIDLHRAGEDANARIPGELELVDDPLIAVPGAHRGEAAQIEQKRVTGHSAVASHGTLVHGLQLTQHVEHRLSSLLRVNVAVRLDDGLQRAGGYASRRSDLDTTLDTSQVGAESREEFQTTGRILEVETVVGGDDFHIRHVGVCRGWLTFDEVLDLHGLVTGSSREEVQTAEGRKSRPVEVEFVEHDGSLSWRLKQCAEGIPQEVARSAG